MVGIKVIGLPQATAYMTAKVKLAMNNAEKGIKQAGFFIEGEVKESIAGQKAEPKSVDTGRFLNSVFTQFGNLSASISSSVNYARALEYGTTRIKPRHHFINTAQRNKHKVQEFIQAEVNKI